MPLPALQEPEGDEDKEGHKSAQVHQPDNNEAVDEAPVRMAISRPCRSSQAQSACLCASYIDLISGVNMTSKDYFTVIKHPMDLSTIRKKLDDRVYQNGQECLDDFTLMFNNCYTFNNPGEVCACVAFLSLFNQVTFNDKQDVTLMAQGLQKYLNDLLLKLPRPEVELEDKPPKTVSSLGTHVHSAAAPKPAVPVGVSSAGVQGGAAATPTPNKKGRRPKGLTTRSHSSLCRETILVQLCWRLRALQVRLPYQQLFALP